MKVSKKKIKSISKYTPSTILSIGHYDIDYLITLTEEDMLKYHIEDVTNLQNYDDISFLINNQYLWDRIQMKTNNPSINLLLYLNKISIDSNKSYIEYIAYEEPVFYNESVKNMLRTVNDFNFFFINNCPLKPEAKKYFSLTIKYKDKETVINFDKCEKDEKNNNADNEILEESGKQEKNEEKKEENQVDLKNENNPFNKIKLDCSQYNYFICSIEESLENDPYEFFIEFVIYVKLNYGAMVAVEYGDVSEVFNDKDSMTLLNKLYLITDIFLFDEKDTMNNFKKHYEIFTKEKSKRKYFENKDNQSNYDLQSQNYKSEINEDNKSQMSYQSIIKNRYNSVTRRKKELTEKDLFEYFKKTIACNGALSILNSKLGIFLDFNFSKVTFIEVPMNIKATTLSYDIKPYPKLSHTTVDLVQLYKGILRQRRDFFRSIFFAGILNKIFFLKRKNFGLEILYSGYLTGHEIVKRLLHLCTNEIPFPDNQKFYIVKINNNDVNEYVKKEFNNKKESKFVLDCVNLEKSKLKNYVPLFDYNLHEFFENKSIQKELINKGFINSKGFVNYDPYYRKGMGVPKNNRFSSASDINNIIKKQVDTNLKNMKRRILPNPVVSTKVKLPVIHCRVSEKVNNYDKYYGKKCNHSYIQKCKYCDLYEKAKIEIDIEEEKKRQMKLRKYNY